MNLNPLFPVQADLDHEIVENHDLHGQDLKKKKLVALLTELFECVNEARFFKFWSKDQKARIKEEIECSTCCGTGDENHEANIESMMEERGSVPYKKCTSCDGVGLTGYSNPLLEEYVDTIHFVLSVALEYGYTKHEYKEPISTDLSNRVIDITYLVASLSFVQDEVRHHQISLIFDYVISLGYQFGFNEKQVIDAYKAKNKVNYERQNTGY